MMSTVAAILSNKPGHVVTIDQHATILDAARLMNQHKIGALMVMRPGPAPIAGILTERDVMTRVVAQCKDPMRTLVSDAMTTPVHSCSPDTPLDEVRGAMRERRIRHVPVMDGQKLAGMVSIGDLNAHETLVLASTVESLEAYITRG
jgi:CBS domain-containing protein